LRIVVVHHALDAGGSARAAIELANHLSERGHAVWLPALARTGDWHYPVDGRVHVTELTHNPPLAPAWRVFVQALPGLRRVLRDAGPDVLISIGALPNFAALAVNAGRRTKLVLSERADPRVMSGRRFSFLRNLVYRVRRADGFVVLTQDAARVVGEWMDRASVHVIPNPAPVVDTLRPRGGSGERMLLAMGRLVPQKGFDVLLDAWALVAPQFPSWRLTIVGEGADRADLETRTRRLGIEASVDMPGFDPQPFAVMARAEVFVLSSRYEGFGQVLLQAMTCAVPVISTDCPSGPAEIMRDGVDGVLVPVGDASALAGAMTRLMSDAGLRDRMGASARERSEAFAPERVWAMWDEVIAAVAG